MEEKNKKRWFRSFRNELELQEIVQIKGRKYLVLFLYSVVETSLHSIETLLTFLKTFVEKHFFCASSWSSNTRRSQRQDHGINSQQKCTALMQCFG